MNRIRTGQQHERSSFTRIFLFAALVWTTMAALILTWEYRDRRKFVIANALSTARTTLDKDIAFRKWAARHGGVYVPTSDSTPPNPYLHVPEREISTPSGKQLTLMNPSYMTRQIFELGKEFPGGTQGHITSLKPIRPENVPDAWERAALESFEAGQQEFSDFKTVSGVSTLRYMRPLKTEKACLACHAAQGYREGDVRGGISVSFTVTDLMQASTRSSSFHSLVIAVIWLFGVGGLWYGYRTSGNSARNLQAERNNLRTIFDASPVGMLLLNEDMVIVRSNNAACQILDSTRQTLVSMRFGEVIGCTNINEYLADGNRKSECSSCGFMNVVIRTFSEEKAVLHEEVQLTITRDGIPSERWLRFGTSPLKIDDDRMVLVSLEDFTDHKKTEFALRDKMDFAENLLHQSSTPTFVIDENHRVLIWNRALEELTGLSSGEIVGTDGHWRAFYPSPRPCLADLVLDGRADDAPGFYAQLSPSRLIPDGMHAEGDFTFRERRCRLVFSAAPLRGQDGKNIAVIETLEDITERISLESQLYQAQKMESIGIMAGGIAHDFNNVLTVINGYADLLQLTLQNDQQSMDIAREISASVERATDMTRRLLAFSGKHELMMQHDDLNRILANIHKSLSRLIREDISLTLAPCGEPLMAYVDRVQIEQVLVNLVVNARDALGNGGQITVSTRAETLETAGMRGSTLIPAGRYACIQVSDNGAGISGETLARIFEPFFTTKDKGKGTGLGLAIVLSIITRHNGYVSVASRAGGGTEFSLYLPASGSEQPPLPAPQELPPTVKQAQDATFRGTETILIAEDDSTIMKLHQEVLGRYGYRVLTAPDGAAALELFEASPDTVSVAVVDVIMPRMNGRELVEEIRRHRPDLPVIMTSGYTDEIIDRETISTLKVRFMQKPVKPTELLATIRSFLQPGESN